MNTTVRTLIFSLILSVVLFACDSSRIMDQNASIENASWSMNDPKTFTFDIEDTLLKYNVLVNVRNSSEFKFRNLYLFIEMTSPKNNYFRDTVEFQLADSKGKWLGSGVGNVWQNQLLLIKGAKMLELGTYNVTISHGMREDTLNEITDVGLRIETDNE